MEEHSPAQPANSDAVSRPQPSRSVSRKVIAWILVFAVAAALFFVVLRSQNTAQTAGPQGAKRAAGFGPVAVVPATAQKGDIGVYLEAIGTVTPVYTSSITSQVTGIVTAVKYREGQMVHKGDPLIEIDSRPFQAQLAQAEGSLEKDTHILAQAKMDLERYRAAWARNAVAKQTLDDQEKAVDQFQGAVKSDQGLVAYDKVQVGYCNITAPFAGRAGLRLIDPGNVVQANGTNPLVVITQEQPITVIFTIAEDSLGEVQSEIRHGQKLEVDAFDRAALKKLAQGKLLTIDNQIDPTTGTVKLRALFDNKDDALFPNQFVNTRLLVKTLKDQILIPASAIQHNGQTAFVYVIQNGTAVIKNVKTGASNAGLTAVEGIDAGDIVANSSFEKLQPNAKVSIAPAQPNQPGNKGGSSGQ